MSALATFAQLVPGVAKKITLAPRASNVLLVPTTAPPARRQDTLAHKQAGPAGGLGEPARVVAVLGPGATFEGLGTRLVQHYTGLTGVTPPSPDELAEAVVFYNRDLLPAGTWTHHRVGLCLPLPIEIDKTTGGWIINADEVRGWAGSFDRAWQARLSTPPTPLDIPEPAVIDGEAEAARRVPGFAAAQWDRALRNPSEAVLTLYAIVRQLADVHLDEALRFAFAFLERANAHNVRMLATTTAGNAILRRLKTALNRTAPTGIDPVKLTTAQKLVDDGLFEGPAAQRTLRRHHEVPETVDLLNDRGAPRTAAAGATADPAGGLHRIVLGRDVAVGTTASTQAAFSGPRFDGRLSLDPFLRDDAKGLNPSDDPEMRGRIALLDDFGVGGGLLDAVRATDAGFLTVGLGAWSASDEAGLAALLSELKREAPDDFDLFFGVHRLDVDKRPGDPGKFVFVSVADDGTRTILNDIAGALRSVFGGTPGAGGSVTFSSDWAARFRLAALVSRRYRRQQVRLAVTKLKHTAVEIAVASVGPFPAGYALELDTGPGSTSRALFTDVQAAVKTFLDSRRAMGISSADWLSGAVIDLTGAPAKPAYAASQPGDDQDTFYVGSMGKVAALYAALELRTRLRKAVAAARPKGLDVTKPGWEKGFLATVRKTWAGRVARGFPGFDTSMARFPKPERMFTFKVGGDIDFTKGTASTAKIAAQNLDPPTSDMKFAEMLTSMILMSNEHAAAVVIDAVEFPYLNGVLREGGFFDPASKRGIWVSGNYRFNTWKTVDAMELSPRGTAHYKATTNFAGNAQQFARLLALLETKKLFDGDAPTCDEMKELMRKHGFPHPVDNSFIQNAVNAIPGVSVDEAYSKIGIGEPVTAGGLKVAGDCAIIVRKKGVHTLRYVAVGVGGYTQAPHGGTFLQFAKVLDQALAAQHR